jgi:hypothetical protein
MGVACGPGYPLQVLAFPARKPNPRSGLYASIPNAALAMPQKRPACHRDFLRISVAVPRNK